MRAWTRIGVGTITGLVLALGTPGLRAELGQTSTTAQRGQLSEGDYKFLANAARGGIEEVELGQLAQQKAASQPVRNFAQRMVADHTRANEELKQIATTKGAALPTQLSRHERSTIEDLQNESGVKFDKDYARAMVKDHKTDVKEFERAAKDVNDPDLKAFAQKTAPILEEHLRMAQELDNTVSNQK